MPEETYLTIRSAGERVINAVSELFEDLTLLKEAYQGAKTLVRTTRSQAWLVASGKADDFIRLNMLVNLGEYDLAISEFIALEPGEGIYSTSLGIGVYGMFHKKDHQFMTGLYSRLRNEIIPDDSIDKTVAKLI